MATTPRATTIPTLDIGGHHTEFVADEAEPGVVGVIVWRALVHATAIK